MSADPRVVVDRFKDYLASVGVTVFLGPLPTDPPNVGLRLYFSGFSSQGSDRERISLEGILSGRGIDPGKYLSEVLRHSRVLSGLLEKGFEYPITASLKAKAEIKLTAEGRFQKDEAEERFDWEYQANYRVELSYNPAMLDDPALAA